MLSCVSIMFAVMQLTIRYKLYCTCVLIGKFQMAVMPASGHVVHEDVPDKASMIPFPMLVFAYFPCGFWKFYFYLDTTSKQKNFLQNK